MKTRIKIFTVGTALLIILGVVVMRYRNVKIRSSSEENSVTSQPEISAETSGAEVAAASLIGTRRAPTKLEGNPPAATVAASGVILEIVNPHGDIWSRQKAARALPLNLSKADQQRLCKFLEVRHEEDAGQGGHVLKNDLMDTLVAQQSVLPELAYLLAAIYHDTTQHEVVRDYAIQHLSMLSERLGEGPQNWEMEQIETQRRQVRDLLWEVTQDSQSSIAGTALIGLTRLIESDASVDRTRLGENALKLAEVNVTQLATRITALQVCARLQVKEALPLLTQLAEKGADTTLRHSAIGALGLVGGRTEIELLQRITEAEDARLAPAAAVALRRIQEREGRL